ncbi:efflux RND transporter permease subunit [bacterium]|nr:efflux RND transporter permease subunit [bacterium]
MKLPRLALENYQFTLIVIILMVVSGIVSLVTMPRSEDPQVTNSGASVYVIYPGANPTDMEQLVVDPLEKAINELEDIRKMSAYMEDGLAVIHTEFELGTDPDDKYSDFLQKINGVRSDLPADIKDLSTEKWAVSNVNIIQVALVSETAEFSDLQAEAERLERAFEKVAGVKQVELWAFPKRQVQIILDPEKMVQMNVPLSQMIGAVQGSSLNIPGGYIDLGKKRFNIQTSGNYQNLDEISRTIVNSTGTETVQVGDVATVNFDYEDPNYYARVNGKRAIFITASQKEQTNIFTITDQLKQVLADFQVALPSSMEVRMVFDQSVSVASRLSTFFNNLLQGLVLVCLVVLAGVGLRASFIVMMAIPISIFIGLSLLDWSGYGIEQMSIAGLVIALGLLVDNAIVVIENISRFLSRGHAHKQAAIGATSQVGWAIVSATATTLLAFLPIIMMRNVTGEFIRSMPLTVIYTLSASLLIALTLTPFLASRMLRPRQFTEKPLVQRLVLSFIDTRYKRFLEQALDRKKAVLISAVFIFLMSLSLFPLIGVSFFPKAEKPQFIINVNTPQGTSLDKTNEAVQYVERALEKRRDLTHYTANIGCSNPRIYYNVIPKRPQSTHGQLFVQLEHYDQSHMSALIDELREYCDRYPEAQIEVKELEQGPPVEAPIAIKILGENLNTLKNIADDAERFFSETPGTVNILNPLSTSKTDLHFVINRNKAGLLGIPIHEIDTTIRMCIAGLNIATFRDETGEEYDLVVRLKNGRELEIEDLDRIFLSSANGQAVPLRHLASIEFKSSPLEIHHYNLERNVTITADVERGFSVDAVTRQIVSKLEAYDWPKGYRYYVSGEVEEQEESFGGLFQAVIVAMIAIFGVLVLQFRSFAQPVIVFVAIPLAVIGSMISLLITGNTFSFMAFIGMASLVGIVVNNSIILVDYCNQLLREGLSVRDAVVSAGTARFLPILLTTVTTIGGLLPLTVLGGSVWAPMGWTIIGGLTTSTFLTLIIVPILYSIVTHEPDTNKETKAPIEP